MKLSGMSRLTSTVAVAVAVLSIVVPAAQASAQVAPVTPALGGCNHPKGAEGQGRPGGTENNMCVGRGVQYVGPTVGSAISVVGPAATGNVINAPVITNGGNTLIPVGSPVV